jgi:diguanylate cyclase (GGDEF)-like protein/PAS domain S-box-containing protein
MWNKLTSSQKWQGELVNKRKNGDIYFEEAHVAPVKNPEGVVTHYVAAKVDITQRKAAEADIAKSRNLLSTIIDSVPVRIFWKDRDLRFIGCNTLFALDAGMMSPEDVVGKDDFQMGWAAQAELYRADDRAVMESGVAKLFYEEPQTTPDGRSIWLSTSKIPLVDQNNETIGVLGIYEDITERKNMQESVQHLAHYDPLTDLPNRTLFDDRLQQALAIAKRDKAHLALIFIDLDKFKPINDTHGHDVGDLLLKEVGKRIHKCLRESDTVARIGGDEFIVLLPMIETEQDALRVAEKIRHSLNQPFDLAEQKLEISSSIGISIYPEHGTDDKQLIHSADAAMYFAKKFGRNTSKIYHADMREQL